VHDSEDDSERLWRKFTREPTIECFLRLRKSAPDIEFDVSLNGGIDHAFALESELSGYGIPPRLYTRVLDADPEAIDELCIILLENMRQEAALIAGGKTHLAGRKLTMPPHLRDWLTCCMIGAMGRYDNRYLSTNLIALLQFRLLPGRFDCREKGACPQ
jgi:hypothetical protein